MKDIKSVIGKSKFMTIKKPLSNKAMSSKLQSVVKNNYVSK